MAINYWSVNRVAAQAAAHPIDSSDEEYSDDEDDPTAGVQDHDQAQAANARASASETTALLSKKSGT